MKKTGWIIVAALVVVICGGVFLYSSGAVLKQNTTTSSTGSEVSSTPSSSAVSDESSTAPESVSSLTDDEIVQKIKSEISLDWDKYTLKEQTDSPVSTGGVTYRTYETWDDDYVVGPDILYNPKDGKLYTCTSEDTTPVLAADDPAYDKTVHTVTGVVTDGAMMSVSIHTTDGSDLTIRRLGITLVNLDNGFQVGQNIKVTYTGVYKGNDSQRMFVTKIEGVQ